MKIQRRSWFENSKKRMNAWKRCCSQEERLHFPWRVMTVTMRWKDCQKRVSGLFCNFSTIMGVFRDLSVSFVWFFREESSPKWNGGRHESRTGGEWERNGWNEESIWGETQSLQGRRPSSENWHLSYHPSPIPCHLDSPWGLNNCITVHWRGWMRSTVGRNAVRQKHTSTTSTLTLNSLARLSISSLLRKPLSERERSAPLNWLDPGLFLFVLSCSEACSLLISHLGYSLMENHAVFFCEGDKYFLEKLDNNAKVTIDGEPVIKKTQLEHNDRLESLSFVSYHVGELFSIH